MKQLSTYLILLSLLIWNARAQKIELLKEVVPGSGFSSIEEEPAFIGDSIMIFAMDDGDDGIYGSELWRTNGTPDGTFMLKDIYPGMYDETTPFESTPRSFYTFKDEVYFSAFAEGKGFELHKTDGTENGTVLIKDIYPDGVGGTNTTTEFIAFKEKLFFSAFSDKSPKNTYNKELWVSDGTTAGTTKLKDINAQSYSDPHNFMIMGDSLYFIARDSSNTDHLWLTDGTGMGTKHVNDTLADKSVRVLKILGVCNNRLLFAGTEDIHGAELWATDGTKEGTTLIKDVNSEPGYDGLKYDKAVAMYNNELYFVGANSKYGTELWKTDGTAEGTYIVADINHTGQDSSAHAYVQLYYEFDGKLVFTAKDSTNKYNIWYTDGTASGTEKVMISGLSESSFPKIINKANDKLYLGASINNDSIKDKSRICSVNNLNSEVSLFQGTEFYYDNVSVLESFVVNNTLIFRADFGLGNGYELYRIVESGFSVGFDGEISEQPIFAAYPNPTSNIVTLSSTAEIKDITLFSSTGQRLKTVINQRVIELSEFPNGVYLIKASDRIGKQYSTTILKN
jgi:ELWxxDGT repeat protein